MCTSQSPYKRLAESLHGVCSHTCQLCILMPLVQARRNPMYQFRETIDLGYTPRTKQQARTWRMQCQESLHTLVIAFCIW
jgi:hypothetical protein